MTTVRTAFHYVMRELGLTTIFGNPGSTEEPFLTDLPADFDYVLGLQEASVVAMADGYSQLTHRPAFVQLHTSGGVGNALGSIASAWHNRAPLIVFAGQQDRRMLLVEPLLTNLRAADLPRPYVKWSYEVARPQDAPAALIRAYAAAVQPPAGPVFLSVPMDDFDAEADPLPAVRSVSTALQASADGLRGVVDALRDAASPAMIVGGAASRGWDDVVRLAETLRCPVWAAPEEGRPGFPETHPQFQGAAPPAIAPLAETLTGHDVVLVVGAPVFRYYPYKAGAYLPAGTRLGPMQIAVLAASGRARAGVYPKPRVVVLSTGNELTAPGTPLAPGKIWDSNSYTLTAAAHEAGCLAYRHGPIPDDPLEMLPAIEDQLLRADLIVTSGGVSMGGEHDVVKETLSRLGTVKFGKVAMQPGMPQGFGVIGEDETPIFTLPGNPVSAYVSFQLFVLPALGAMQGQPERRLPSLPATTTGPLRSPPGRRSYLRGVLDPAEGTVTPLTGQGSHQIATLGRANALIIVPEWVVSMNEGDSVEVLVLP